MLEYIIGPEEGVMGRGQNSPFYKIRIKMSNLINNIDINLED